MCSTPSVCINQQRVMKDEGKIKHILWEIDWICTKASKHTDEGELYWNEDRNNTLKDYRKDLEYFLYNDFFEEDSPGKKHQIEVKRILEHIGKTICLLFDTWRAFEPYVPQGIVNTIGRLSDIETHIEDEFNIINELNNAPPPTTEEDNNIPTQELVMLFLDDNEVSSDTRAKTFVKACKRFGYDTPQNVITQMLNMGANITKLRKTSEKNIAKYLIDNGILPDKECKPDDYPYRGSIKKYIKD